ncbi:MAG: restriction endonuclease subunit S [Herbinix sp.]|nr:restriction endonuclease subunit S [Herbinix sp.]
MNYSDIMELKLNQIFIFSNGKKRPSEKGNIPVYGGNGVLDYCDNFNTEGESIVIGRVGAYCGSVYCENNKIWVSDNAILAKVKDDFDFYFMYYLLLHMKLNDFHIGSSQPLLTQEILNNLSAKIPNPDYQKRSGQILKYLDDKIRLNYKLNDNLELLISNIYESWFENFSVYEETEFKESEIGLIPASWELVELDNVCESVSKKHAFDKEQLIFLNTGDVTNGQFAHSNYSEVSSMPGQAKKSIKQNDILYSEIRPINQHYAYVNFDSEDYVVSTKLMVIRAKSISPRRLYNFLTSQKIINDLQMEAESRSGTFPQITFDIIKKKRILIADKITEEKFSRFLEDVYEKVDSNIKENTLLSEIRNTLLTKLMAGELDLEC